LLLDSCASCPGRHPGRWRQVQQYRSAVASTHP
jgi:hypothetical protein